MSDEQSTRLEAILADFDDDTPQPSQRARTREEPPAPIALDAATPSADTEPTSNLELEPEHDESSAEPDAKDPVAAVTAVIDRGNTEESPTGAPALLDQLDAMWGAHGHPTGSGGPSPADATATRVAAQIPPELVAAGANRQGRRGWARRATAFAMRRFVLPAGAAPMRRTAPSWVSAGALLVLDAMLVALLALALTGNAAGWSPQRSDTTAEPPSRAGHHTSQP